MGDAAKLYVRELRDPRVSELTSKGKFLLDFAKFVKGTHEVFGLHRPQFMSRVRLSPACPARRPRH